MKGIYQTLLIMGGIVALGTALSTGVYNGMPKKVYGGQLGPETKVVQWENGHRGWLHVPYTETKSTKDGKTVVIYDAWQDGKLNTRKDKVFDDEEKYIPGKQIKVPIYDSEGKIAGYESIECPRLTKYESQLASINERIKEMRKKARMEGIEKITQEGK